MQVAEGPLVDKVAIITGGTRGIGFGIARAFVAAGAAVALTGRDPKRGAEAVTELASDARALFIQGDGTNRFEVDAAIEASVAHFGQLDVLVNNVGAVPAAVPVSAMSDDAWLDVLNANVTSAFFASRKMLEYLLPQQSGRIINVSSVQGKRPAAYGAAYSAGKQALNALTIALAREVGTMGITVNAVCPGLVATDRTQQQFDDAFRRTSITADSLIERFTSPGALKRLTTVDEVAALAVFLASDAAGGITGALLSVDGGLADY